MKKMIYSLLILILIGAGATYYYVFVYSKNHHRDVQQETAIIISSDALVAAYEASDSIANVAYLNKALEIKGPIALKDTNAVGQITLLLGDIDPFKKRVSITLNTKTPIIQKMGDTITVKGKCTGNLTDVVITDGVIK
jgi:hypothetical protein